MSDLPDLTELLTLKISNANMAVYSENPSECDVAFAFDFSLCN